MGSRVAFFWRSDTTADGDACCLTCSCRPADTAAASLSTWAQDGSTLMDGATVSHCPPRWTGHLHLRKEQRQNKEGGKMQVLFYLNLKYAPPLYQLISFPPGGTPEQERGSTRRVMSRHLSRHSASCCHDVDGNRIRSHLWTTLYIL